MFRLRFPETDIREWADQYSALDEDRVIEPIAAAARARGSLTRNEFLEIAQWKSRRPRKRYERNSNEYVQEVTHASLHSREPRFKIEVLRLLDGVEWPTASVILHLCDKERWPIVDFRAFWSLRHTMPASGLSFDLWDRYVSFTRALADRTGVDMRTLDRALWAYSREKQRAGV